jgi:hypothetical protein
MAAESKGNSTEDLIAYLKGIDITSTKKDHSKKTLGESIKQHEIEIFLCLAVALGVANKYFPSLINQVPVPQESQGDNHVLNLPRTLSEVTGVNFDIYKPAPTNAPKITPTSTITPTVK